MWFTILNGIAAILPPLLAIGFIIALISWMISKCEGHELRGEDSDETSTHGLFGLGGGGWTRILVAARILGGLRGEYVLVFWIFVCAIAAASMYVKDLE
jgi:hypothetical protein